MNDPRGSQRSATRLEFKHGPPSASLNSAAKDARDHVNELPEVREYRSVREDGQDGGIGQGFFFLYVRIVSILTALCVSIERFLQNTAPICCLPFVGIGAAWRTVPEPSAGQAAVVPPRSE